MIRKYLSEALNDLKKDINHISGSRKEYLQYYFHILSQIFGDKLIIEHGDYIETQVEKIHRTPSVQHEYNVASYLNTFPNILAMRTKNDVTYPDIKIYYNDKKTWLEVKMNHTDNLFNARVAYIKGKWTCGGKDSPVKQYCINKLSTSQYTNKFIEELSIFSGIPENKMILPSSRSQLDQPNAVPYSVMKSFLEKRDNQYILHVSNTNLGDLTTMHYLKGKTEPAHYMQAGDDFYRIGNNNPLQLSENIPILSGNGDFKFRIGLRHTKQWYELQPEIKIKHMPYSQYSVHPQTKKLNPFT